MSDSHLPKYVIVSSLALSLYLKNYWHFGSVYVVWGSKIRCLGSVFHNYGILYSKAFLWWCIGLRDGEKILKCGRRERRVMYTEFRGNWERKREEKKRMREDAELGKICGESRGLLLWPLLSLCFVRYFLKIMFNDLQNCLIIFTWGWDGNRGATSNSHLPHLRLSSWCHSALEDHLHVSSPGMFWHSWE